MSTSRASSVPPPASEPPLQLHLAEQEFHTMVEHLEERIMHHSDRPEIEHRILGFLAHAAGPSTAGIAAQMGISAEAAAVHLASLSEAGRAWSQAIHGEELGWHISNEGSHFLKERGRTGAGS